MWLCVCVCMRWVMMRRARAAACLLSAWPSRPDGLMDVRRGGLRRLRWQLAAVKWNWITTPCAPRAHSKLPACRWRTRAHSFYNYIGVAVAADDIWRPSPMPHDPLANRCLILSTKTQKMKNEQRNRTERHVRKQKKKKIALQSAWTE